MESKALNAFSRAVGPRAPSGPLRAQRAHHSETIGIFPGASLRQALSSAAAVDLLLRRLGREGSAHRTRAGGRCKARLRPAIAAWRALRKVGFLRSYMTMHGRGTEGEMKGRLVIAWPALELLAYVRLCFRESFKDPVTWCGLGWRSRACMGDGNNLI